MAGILNNKERLFDTILTNEGRKQIAQGNLKAQFVSFTDAGTIYNIDTIVSGGLDVTDRIQLEATNLLQDTIAIEADDSGRLTGFPISGSTRFVFRSGQILSSSTGLKPQTVTGSQFASLSDVLLSSSIDNFKKLYILRSSDPVDNKVKNFVISTKTKEFIITDKIPFKKRSISTARLDHVESFFQDKRLSNLPNYIFLPPVNRARLGDEQRIPLGNFVNLNQQPILSFKDIEKEIEVSELKGLSQDFKFTETSRESNIIGQLFELNANEALKLDVIDFGTFLKENGKTSHVFFAGKVFLDSNRCHTFVNMFTIIFE